MEELKNINWNSKEEVIYFCELLAEPVKTNYLMEKLSEHYGKPITYQSVTNQYNRLVSIIGNCKSPDNTYFVEDQGTALELITIYYDDKESKKIQKSMPRLTVDGKQITKRKYVRKIKSLNDMDAAPVQEVIILKDIDERKVLTKLTEAQRLEFRYKLFQVVYFSKDGLTPAEAREEYFKRFKSQLNEVMIKGFFKEFEDLLPSDSYTIYGSRFRILNYIDGIRVIYPSKVNYHAIIELPKGKHHSDYGEFSAGTVHVLGNPDDYDGKCLCELSQYNNRDQYRALVRLVANGGKILSPESLGKKIATEIEEWILSINEVVI